MSLEVYQSLFIQGLPFKGENQIAWYRLFWAHQKERTGSFDARQQKILFEGGKGKIQRWTKLLMFLVIGSQRSQLIRTWNMWVFLGQEHRHWPNFELRQYINRRGVQYWNRVQRKNRRKRIQILRIDQFNLRKGYETRKRRSHPVRCKHDNYRKVFWIKNR